jgi:hypothetical protein
MFEPRKLIGTHDVLFITFDSLRYDVACRALVKGLTPGLAQHLPRGEWEKRETPGNFTYAAHHAFFAGFLPTPPNSPKHPRLFSARFDGSETTTADTVVFDTPDIVSGFAGAGYHTVCIGGVGFFNKQNPLGSVFPSLFHESHWSEETGVTSKTSTEAQVHIAVNVLSKLEPSKRVFMFINVSATHQPNCIFDPSGATEDNPVTQAHALSYADKHLTPLFNMMQRRADTMVIACSDHGTAYGEDGQFGHRNNHPTVLTVPYAEFILERAEYASA